MLAYGRIYMTYLDILSVALSPITRSHTHKRAATAGLRGVGPYEEVGRQLVVAGGDPAEVRQLGEEALDPIALATKPPAEAGLPASVTLRRDVRCGTLLSDQLRNGRRRRPCRPARWCAAQGGRAAYGRSVHHELGSPRPSRIGSPCASRTTRILVVSPPRERPRQ